MAIALAIEKRTSFYSKKQNIWSRTTGFIPIKTSLKTIEFAGNKGKMPIDD